jgi:hypothetical protein
MEQFPHKPKTRFRLLMIVLVLLAGLWAAAWVTSLALAPVLVRKAIPKLTAQLAGLGIGFRDVSVKTTRVSPFLNGIARDELYARFDLNLRDKVQLQSTVDMQEVELRLANPLAFRGNIRISAAEERFDKTDLPRALPFDRFANASLTVGNLPITRPRQIVQEIRRKLKAPFFDNAAVGNVRFSGDVKLTVEEVEMAAHLYTEQDNNLFRLHFRQSGIQALSDLKNMGLAPEQVKIVSYYPIRVSVIMLVTDQANDSAGRHETDDVWLRDAHRHVTWSFLLTQHFGPDFATQVTDAQEMRPGNTPNERAMDFHNNAIGRRLFAEGAAVETLAQQVREHPDIIRHPDEVDTFKEHRLLR